MTKVLHLYDDITPALAKQFVADMAKLKTDDAVTIAVNSPGGSVPAGDAIALAIDRHSGPTTCRVDGVAASAASFICCFADRVVMSPGSFQMIHLPYTNMVGTADDLVSAAGVLKEIERRYISTYAVRTGLPEAEIRKMLVAETWLSAARAVALGFADEIDTSLVTAKTVSPLALQFKHTPREVRAMAGERPKHNPDRDRRDRQRRRMAIIAAQAASTRKQEQADAELGALVRRRRELAAVVESGRAEAVRRDAAERSAARQALEAGYCRRWHNIPGR